MQSNTGDTSLPKANANANTKANANANTKTKANANTKTKANANTKTKANTKIKANANANATLRQNSMPYMPPDIINDITKHMDFQALVKFGSTSKENQEYVLGIIKQRIPSLLTSVQRLKECTRPAKFTINLMGHTKEKQLIDVQFNISNFTLREKAYVITRGVHIDCKIFSNISEIHKQLGVTAKQPIFFTQSNIENSESAALIMMDKFSYIYPFYKSFNAGAPYMTLQFDDYDTDTPPYVSYSYSIQTIRNMLSNMMCHTDELTGRIYGCSTFDKHNHPFFISEEDDMKQSYTEILLFMI